nr:hypothetical protein CFP56_27262 [Quercus suber]
MCSTSTEASECGGSALLEPKVFTTPKLEAVEEDKQASPNLAIPNDLLEKMKGVNFTKAIASGHLMEFTRRVKLDNESGIELENELSKISRVCK